MRILIIHPEGNINNNPNLTAIVNALHDKGFSVDVFSQANSSIYQNGSKSFNIHCIYYIDFLRRFMMSKRMLAKVVRYLFGWIGKSYNFIIGVDANGIIIGDIISRASGVPLAFISYEIFFADEIGAIEKLPEIKACKNICFAVCPDSVRAEMLSRENQIPLDKIFCIPVSGVKIDEQLYDREYIHKKYVIDKSKKIALYMGSLDDWAGKNLLLEDIKNWPPDWVLLLHGRYKPSRELWQELQAVVEQYPERLILSDKPFVSFAEMYSLPMSADIGIALYFPDYKSYCTGKNIEFIGLSSGKINSYLNCGLPLLVNKIGVLSDDVAKSDMGFVLDDGMQPSDVLKSITTQILERQKENCKYYFSNNIDFNIYRENLIARVMANRTATKSLLFTNRVGIFCFITNNLYRIYRAVRAAWRLDFFRRPHTSR